MAPKVIFCLLFWSLTLDIYILIFILQMLYSNRSDVSESIDAKKTSTSKKASQALYIWSSNDYIHQLHAYFTFQKKYIVTKILFYRLKCQKKATRLPKFIDKSHSGTYKTFRKYTHSLSYFCLIRQFLFILRLYYYPEVE